MVEFSTSSGWTKLLAQAAPPVAGSAGNGDAAGTPGTISPGGIPPTNGAPGPQPGAGGFGLILPMMMVLFVLMIFTSVMSGRKEKKRRQGMLGSLARYDRVQTAGGMIGTIVEIKGDEVVLKVDESTNTKIHFSRSSVQTVLKRGPAGIEAAETAA